MDSMVARRDLNTVMSLFNNSYSRRAPEGPVSLWGTFVGQLTRTALYVPQFLKLQFNQFVSPLTGKRK